MHKRIFFIWLLTLIIITTIGLFLTACGTEDDDDNDAIDDDAIDDDVNDDDVADDDLIDDDLTDDDAVDDDAIDDDVVDDDIVDDDVVDDDTADDDTVFADDYLAPWPQQNIETQDYNEVPDAGYLRQKADEYFAWSVEHHQPFFGGLVHTKFTDDTYTDVVSYGGYGDCTIWTGTYLGSQAFHYHVTGDEDVKNNAIHIAEALSEHLHVTGRTGFIARYRAMQDPTVYGGDDWCALSDRCHNYETGPYADQFWWGETSRDQYTGWFFGMALAYDLVDDEDMRDMIRADVSEVLNTLMDDNWWIIDEAGQPTDAAPNVLPPMRLSWLTIGYHITGEQRIKTELQKYILDEKRIQLQLSSIAFLNRYAQYYGNNLAHTNWYNLLRLGEVYFSADDYNWLENLFEQQVHTFTRLSHNPWFNGIRMSQGDYEPTGYRDEYQDQLTGDLTDFPDAPNVVYHLPERTGYTLDPLSVFLHDLQVQWPWLEELIGGVDYQAKDAFPVQEQCESGFLFQRNPFQIEECGTDDPTNVHSGTDYLVSYWLASYHKFITKDM